MSTQFYNIHTGAAAEILAEDETTVTFRTLPVGRPNTIPREKFEKAYHQQAPQPEPEKIPQPPKPKDFNGLGLQAVTPVITPVSRPPKPKVYRDRRAYYRANQARLRAKSLAYYYLRKLKEDLLPLSEAEKNRIAEERERRKAYQREWWHRKKKSGQKVDNSGQEPPESGSPAGGTGVETQA